MKLSIENLEKEKLIKELAKKRIPEYTGINVDSLSAFDLMGLPEATIVTIVGTYSTMKYKQRIPENKIIEKMQALRSSFGDLGEPVSKESFLSSMEDFISFFNYSTKSASLKDYIKYRLDIEYPFTVLPDNELIDEAIEKAKRVFISQDFFCVKCSSEIYQKSDSFFRLLLIGVGGIKSFPRYYCPNCGKLKYKDLSIGLRKKIFRARMIELLIFIILITLLIIFG